MPTFHIQTVNEKTFTVKAHAVSFNETGWVLFKSCPRDPRDPLSGEVKSAFPVQYVGFILMDGCEPEQEL